MEVNFISALSGGNHSQSSVTQIDQHFSDLLKKFIAQDNDDECYWIKVYSVSLNLKEKTDQLRVILRTLIELGDIKRISGFLASLDENEKKELWGHQNKYNEPILKELLQIAAEPAVLEVLMKEGATFQSSWVERYDLIKKYLISPHLDIYYKAIMAGATHEDLKNILNGVEDGGQTLLHRGVKQRISAAMLATFVKDGALLSKDHAGKTPLHEAASDPQMFDKIPVLLTNLPAKEILEEVNVEDAEGRTPLEYAVNHGISAQSMRDFLLLYGAKIDPRKCSGRADFSSLHYAILTDASVETCQELLFGLNADEQRDFVNRQDRDGFTALHYAANRKLDEGMIRFLLKAGASPSMQSHIGYTAIHSAVVGGAKLVAVLLENESPQEQARIVKLLDQKGKSALTHAAERKYSLHQAHVLIQLGADINDLKAITTPLLFALATHAPRQEIIAILQSFDPQELDIQLNSFGSDGLTLLHHAFYCGVDPDIIELLIEFGAESKANSYGATPFHLVDFKNPQSLTYYEALLKGDRAAILTSSNLSFLIHKNADPALIEFMAQRGCPVDESHLFSARNHTLVFSVLRSLLSCVPVNDKKEMLAVIKEGNTLLASVINLPNCEPALVRFLVNEGASITPEVLNIARIRSRCLETWLALLEPLSEEEREKVLNMKVSIGLTILHIAVSTGFDFEIIKLFIKYGVSLNAQDDEGDTPLHLAAKRRTYSLVKLLLSYGADPNITNHKNRRALDDPEQWLALKRVNEIRLSRISYVDDASKRILDFHYENPLVKEGNLLILQGRSDDIGAFTIYSDHITVNLELLLSLSQCYRTTRFEVIENSEEMITALRSVEGDTDLLISGHGFGEMEMATTVQLGGANRFSNENEEVFTLLQEKCMNGIVMYMSCKIGRAGEPISIPQKTALAVPGVTVIASEESFDLKNMQLFPEDLIKMRFFVDGRDTTVVYQNGIRSKPPMLSLIKA